MRQLLSYLLVIATLAVTSCSSVGSRAPSTHNISQSNLRYSAFVNNQGSMTKALKSLHHHFTVELLKTGIDNDSYVRISSLKLDNTPVIAAITSAKVTNKTFVSILVNAKTTPLGKMLFDPKYQIKRAKNMSIKAIMIADIPNQTIRAYLTSNLHYPSSQILVARTSTFYHKKETMDITEYLLPNLKSFVEPNR